MSGEPMNRRDRDQLAQVAKMRARVAKSSIEQREMVLRSQVEAQLEDLYNADREHLAKAMGIAMSEAERWDKELQERLTEYGTPEHLRPHIHAAHIKHEGEQKERSAAQRHASLRGVANTRIRALGAAAKVSIDQACADTVTQLVAGGLSGADAQQFLDAMPTIDQLMMAPSVAELEAVHDDQQRGYRQLERGW